MQLLGYGSVGGWAVGREELEGRGRDKVLNRWNRVWMSEGGPGLEGVSDRMLSVSGNRWAPTTWTCVGLRY